MPNARIVLAHGPINGVNTVFGTGIPYVPGTAAYILNGRIHNQVVARGPDNDFGFVELDPDGGTIQVDVPPDIDDVVQIFFSDRLATLIIPPSPALRAVIAFAVLPGTAITPPVTTLAGVIQRTPRLEGTVRDTPPDSLTGVVRRKQLVGTIRETEPERLVGVVGSQRIIGTIKEGC